jgi:hypothetical protein
MRSSRALSWPMAAGLLALALALAGCGGSGTPSGSATSSSATSGATGGPTGTTGAGATGSSGVVTLHATLQFSGASSASFAFDSPVLASKSCSAIAAHGTDDTVGLLSFAMPDPSTKDNVSMTASVAPYTGPGSYGIPNLLKGGGTDIFVGSSSYNAIGPGATDAVTIAADASGSWTFTGAVQVTAGPTLSGKINWTCSG